MLRAIFFLGMGFLLFFLPQIIKCLLSGEEIKIKANIYLILAFVLPASWMFLPTSISDIRYINFLQHAIGGGVAVGLVGIYLIESFKNRYGAVTSCFFIQITFIYMLVSALGVANELLEFFLDTFKVGIFSGDRLDTWFDLTANTFGALGIFLVYRISSFFRRIS